ncbi:MAG: acyl-CoA thioesterase [Spirochaetales bacterium]|nr:acyl-CoA thioesterase [Spirochaetales bacterium]
MDEKKLSFSLEFLVRDYECDLQGIVNNAVYLHYLEHTRHEFLKDKGLDFEGLHRQGVDPVVVRMEIDYLFPLTSGDRFTVLLSPEKRGRLRIVFNQEIIRQPDKKPVLKAVVVTTCLKEGRLYMPDDLAEGLF